MSCIPPSPLYKTYRNQGLFYGSGVVEGGCRSVIGQRLKESGMFWTEAGATSVLNLRLAFKSTRWDECWNRLNHSDYLKIKIPPFGSAGPRKVPRRS